VTPFAFSPPWPTIFSDYYLLVHHPVKRDDWQLLAHAMASDWSYTSSLPDDPVEEVAVDVEYVTDAVSRRALPVVIDPALPAV
jgi:hypothetical protein